MLKKLRISVFILVIFFIGFFTVHLSGGSVVSRTPEEVREAFKSVVEVHVTVIWRGELELEGGGSGSFVAPGYVLTAPHIASEFHQVVMDPQTRIEVEVGGKIYRTKIVAVDWREELMLLKVEGVSWVPVVKLALGVEEEDTVFITGYISNPLGTGRYSYISAPALIFSINEKISKPSGDYYVGITESGKTGPDELAQRAMEKYGVSKLLTIYGKTGKRVSGGPVFNTKGEVVGVSWLMMDDYVFATPVDIIREFLEEHLDNFKKDG